MLTGRVQVHHVLGHDSVLPSHWYRVQGLRHCGASCSCDYHAHGPLLRLHDPRLLDEALAVSSLTPALVYVLIAVV